MTGVGSSSRSSSRNNGAPMSGGMTPPHAFTQETKARLFLFMACLWPLWVLALFGASSNATTGGDVVGPAKEVNRLNLRNVMDRVDIMGYGPTHPRVAFVVLGEDAEPMKATVESIFRNTDLNRIFLICAVMDGQGENKALVDELHEMDQGSVPHWHGLRPDIHIGLSSSNKKGEDDPHGRKIHAMFHPQRVGTTAARMEAVDFVKLLEKKHMDAGLKSPEEDLILVLLQAGIQLTDHSWLQAVTHALIVPPPILRGDEDVALKLANAVSLQLEAPGLVTSFDEKMAPLLQVEAKADDINLSSGASYSTPALNGAGIALRLDTFVHLPAQDPSLMDPWPANLELALNLWLCADGIDILQDAQITTTTSWMDNLPTAPLDPHLAARFAAVWMDDAMQQRFFQAYSSKITRLDWQTKMQHARQSPTFPKGDISKRCRPFEWYAKQVNTHLGKVLDQTAWERVDNTGDANEKKGGTIKKEEMQQVAAKIEVHDERNQVEANPNIRANKEEQQQRQAKQEEKPVVVKQEEKPKQPMVTQKLIPLKVVEEAKEEQINHEDHHEPPPVDEHAVDEHKADAVVSRRKPKIPLRKENLEIVQKAKPIDIAYVPVHGDHKEHPHMGAKDENGNLGYIHDETALRRNPPPFSWEEKQEREACSMRDNNFRMMTQRVVVDMEYDKQQNAKGVKRDKIFCLVYTIESGHPRIPYIRETWGPKCDGFMVGSTKTDKSIDAVEIPHEGPEEYNNIWQKVRSMWSYIYDNYYEKYDWFHIGGDDLFLIVENMRLYLESEEIRTAANGGIYLPFGNETMQTPLLLGRRFAYQGNMDEIFDSGGSGYTMNKAAFKLLVTEGFTNYFPHAHTFSEDTMVAKIFRKMDVYAYDTKDEDGGERYMPFLPGHHWGYRLPKDPSKDWYAKYSINIKEGPEHCSPKSLAFHYVKDMMMKRLFALAYALCSDKYMQQ